MTTAPVLSVVGTIASAMMCVLTAHPFELWALAPICLAPFALALSRASMGAGLSLGLLHGSVVNALGFHWMLPPLREVAGLSTVGALTLFSFVCLAQAGRTALTGLLCVTCARRGWPLIASFPFAVVAVEALYPMIFPWYAGVFALASTPWVQLAEFGGPLLVSLFVSACAAATAGAWQLGRTPSMLRPAATGIGILAIVTGFGYARLAALSAEIASAPALHIGVVQGNLGPAHLEVRDAVEVYAAESLRLRERSRTVDFFVWPESVAARPVRESVLPAFIRDEIFGRMGTAAADAPVSILFGIVLEGDDGLGTSPHGDGRLWNSAVLADSTGAVLGRYDKRALIPLGEKSVGVSLLGLRAVTRFEPGRDRAPLVVAGRRVAVTICYEDLLHRSFRDSVRRDDPELLVNLTSDVWFRGSAGPRLHLALASLRAVEHRRFLLRATTTGVASLIDPAGRLVWSLPEARLASGVAEIRWMKGGTLYGTLGDWPWMLTAFAGLAALGMNEILFRRRRGNERRVRVG